MQKYFLGSVLSGGSSDPPDGNSAQSWLDFVNGFKAQALQTRLKIPLLYGIDAVHGHNNIDGAVIFPHHLGMGATHDPQLVETRRTRHRRGSRRHRHPLGVRAVHRRSAGRALGPHLRRLRRRHRTRLRTGRRRDASVCRAKSFPTSRLPCWPARNISSATAAPPDGIDQGNTVCDEATLRKLYLPPYRAAIEAGVGSIMVSYSSWNGLKMHGNKYLLTDVLKGELGFQGFLVSDWAAIDQISPDYKKDVEQSINAGLDMIMIPRGPGKTNNYVEFITDLKALVAEGKVSQARIDDAVRRILRIKFQMGLFENNTHGSRNSPPPLVRRNIARSRVNVCGNRWCC